ncbi:hypothetical protein KBC99_02400 [Candidatus Saccharibacteria bacterium]|nr:hypothetical protein [Candidatus Saccharibacteria bacterium]
MATKPNQIQDLLAAVRGILPRALQNRTYRLSLVEFECTPRNEHGFIRRCVEIGLAVTEARHQYPGHDGRIYLCCDNRYIALELPFSFQAAASEQLISYTSGPRLPSGQ